MRLAFVLFHWFPFGGLQQDLVKIVLACKDKSDITVYCMSWEGERIAGVNLVVVPVSGLFKTTQQQQFVKFIQAHVSGHFDKVLGFNRMPGLDYYFAADTCFAEKAYNERGWWYRQTPRALQFLSFEKSVFGAASTTQIMLLSPAQRDAYIRHYQTAAERMILLTPGISREHMATANSALLRANLREEFGIAENDFLVLQVGSSFLTKGVDRSLQALAALPDGVKRRTHYFLVGHDDAASWLGIAAKQGVHQIRMFAGRDDIPRFMQGADVLLHPSRHESAGMVLLEAIVAGLPVVTTANCGYAFHVVHADAGIVCAEPFNQHRLNTALSDMLQTDRTSWQHNGIRYGKQHNLYAMPQAVASILLGERTFKA